MMQQSVKKESVHPSVSELAAGSDSGFQVPSANHAAL